MDFIHSSTKDDSIGKIVFFDGVCNICNKSVDYVLKHSKNTELKIASLQGTFANGFLSEDLQKEGFETFLYYNGTNFSKASEAVFQVAKELNGFLPFIIRVFSVFPRFLTDYAYYLIARNRYFLAGKRSSCRLPTIEEKARFLD